LRLTLAETPPCEESLQEVLQFAGLEILIVDDNSTNRHVLEKIVRRWGANPVSVNSGQAALEELRRAYQLGKHYPLMLIDAMMPDMDGFMFVEKLQAEQRGVMPTIMMLTSADRHEDANRCRQLGIQSYLVKPIVPRELEAAVGAALANRSVRDGPAPLPTASTPHFPNSPSSAAEHCGDHDETSPATGLKVLVAEDNPINQRVAEQMLLRGGHRVTMLSNGREVLEAIQRQTYDLLLLDIQMPELDGWETTRLLRAAEDEQNRPRLPIIAMTAHAMPGDRERCLAAGMDEYLSKPIDMALLYSVLDGQRQQRDTREESEKLPPNPPQVAFDPQQTLRQLGGDQELLAEIIAMFLETTPLQLAEMRQAQADQDGKHLRKATHALKGSLGYFSHEPLRDWVEQLEKEAEGGEFTKTAVTLAQCEKELTKLMSQLKSYRSAVN
jgi:two-component system, sensor histidine kinase and response regulator